MSASKDKIGVAPRMEKPMGRFAVDIALANFVDMQLAKMKKLSPDKVRRTRVSGIVDSGAVRLVLPASVVKELGLPLTGETKVRYADGRKKSRKTVAGAFMELLGRSSTFNAIVEPDRTTALIGAIVLEELDFLVDSTNQRLIPRDPHFVINEIE